MKIVKSVALCTVLSAVTLFTEAVLSAKFGCSFLEGLYFMAGSVYSDLSARWGLL